MAGDELDKDLAKSLQVAKKKPRNFAIIAKGANVLKLLVDKKPLKEGVLLKAKKELQGNAIVKGVVRGDGPELVFEVIEEPSIAEPKLKKYISDETRLTVKPRFQVVASLQEIDDDTPDQVGEESAPTSTPGDVPPTAPPPPVGPDAAAARFTARLKALRPGLEQVISAGVSVSQETKLRASEAAALARKPDFVAANQVLDQVETLVRQGLEQLSARPTGGGDLAAQFTARLKTLMPAIKQAIDTGTPTGAEIRLKTSEAGTRARTLEFVEANRLLDEVEALLGPAPSGPTPPPGPETSEVEEDEEEDDEADAALFEDRAGPSPKTVRGEQEVPEGFVDYAKARLAWETARRGAEDELRRLQQAILAECDAMEELPAITQAVQRLEPVLAVFNAQLGATLDAALNARGQERQKYHDEASKLIRRHLDYAHTDRILNLLDDNPFQPVNIQNRLVTALEELDSQIRA